MLAKEPAGSVISTDTLLFWTFRIKRDIVKHSFHPIGKYNMDHSSDKLLNLQIAGLHGLYWMIFCPIYSYVSVYLLSKNFSNQDIGWVMAVGNILAIFLQPFMGTILDRFEKLTLKNALIGLAIICLVLLAGLIFLDAGLAWMAVFYVGIVALLLTMQPLVNAITFEYINAGHDVNFGVTRAMGSICFAILSTLLGFWLNRFSTAILPITCMILYFCFLLLALTFKPVDKHAGIIHQNADKETSNLSEAPVKTGFVRKYEYFIPLLIGISGLFTFHTVINTFLAQIISSLNGQNTDFGVSLTIAAVCELPAFLGFSYLVSKFNVRSLLKFSGAVYMLRSFIFLIAALVWMVNVGQVFQGISFAIFIPASVYYINEIMRDEDKVKGQTSITGAITLGSFVGSVIGGWLLDHYDVTAMLIFGAAAAIIGGMLIFYAVRNPKRDTNIELDASRAVL